jgi:phosphate starvation-inducible PhoH-like protein
LPEKKSKVMSSNQKRVDLNQENFVENNFTAPRRIILGPDSINLKILSERLDFKVGQRGGELLFFDTDPQRLLLGQKALRALDEMPTASETPSQWEVECLASLLKANPDLDLLDFFSCYRPQLGNDRLVVARTLTQKLYLNAIRNNDLVFGLGPAGTGKTFLAVTMAVEALNRGQVNRLILTRPAVEAGERLGFLPGDLAEKIDPYLRPLYDALSEVLPQDKYFRLSEKRVIEVAPLAFMRGRTLSGAFVILDEAQNTTCEQMKMFLTRLGPGSKAVVTGDPGQSDLPGGHPKGLLQAMEILPNLEGIAFCYFTNQDVVRHRLVKRILEAYEGRSSSSVEPKIKKD